MVTFTYTAYSDRGQRIIGEISAPTRQAALDVLHRQGTTPVAIAEKPYSGPALVSTRTWFRRRALSPGDMLLFARELATLVAAELPLDDSLRIVALQPSLSQSARRLVSALLDRVLSGAPLSEALAIAPDDIHPTFRHQIAAAEKSGSITNALLQLADSLEREADLQAHLRGALLYPITLLVAAILTVTLVIGVLVPAIVPLFDESGAKPPFVIGVLDTLRTTLVHWWPLVLLVAILVPLALAAASRHTGFRQVLDRIMLRLPILGRLIARRETARFAGTLATLLASGLPLLEALRVVGATHSNHGYRTAVTATEALVANGGTLTDAMARSGLFTPLALQLTGVGERTGQIDTMLARLARIEEAELRRQLERLVAIVAPMLTILIGVVVGGIILSVMGAIVGLNDLAFR